MFKSSNEAVNLEEMEKGKTQTRYKILRKYSIGHEDAMNLMNFGKGIAYFMK